MKIVGTKTEKRTRLHTLKCAFCGDQFGSYRNTSKVCSKACSNLLNGKMKNKSSYRTCITCGNIFTHKPSEDRRGSVHSHCSRACLFPNKKLGLPEGQYYSYDGYIVLSRTEDGRKQVKLHRYIMEKCIGRRLSSSEIVHHISHDKLDNRIENLQIVTRSEHNILHEFLKK